MIRGKEVADSSPFQGTDVFNEIRHIELIFVLTDVIDYSFFSSRSCDTVKFTHMSYKRKPGHQSGIVMPSLAFVAG